jgi:hypothetical protein
VEPESEFLDVPVRRMPRNRMASRRMAVNSGEATFKASTFAAWFGVSGRRQPPTSPARVGRELFRRHPAAGLRTYGSVRAIGPSWATATLGFLTMSAFRLTYELSQANTPPRIHPLRTRPSLRAWFLREGERSESDARYRREESESRPPVFSIGLTKRREWLRWLRCGPAALFPPTPRLDTQPSEMSNATGCIEVYVQTIFP